MDIDTIQTDFRRKVGQTVSLVEEGVGRYRVFTPFMFEDGDHLAIIIRRDGNQWVLTDEGHTYMHLTYDLDEKDLQQGTRQKIITNALASFSVEDQDGELRLAVPQDQYGNALFTFIQALLKISDVTYLSRERVRSTFMDDFHAFLEQVVPEARRTFDWFDPDRDPEGKYTADCRINHLSRPIMVYALSSDDRARDATISLLQYERWNLAHRSVAIFEDQESVNRKVLARLSDVCDKQLSNLGSDNKQRLQTYLDAAMAGNP